MQVERSVVTDRYLSAGATGSPDMPSGERCTTVGHEADPAVAMVHLGDCEDEPCTGHPYCRECVGVLADGGEVVGEWLVTRSDASIARKLIEDALFLRMYGERPPGAPKADPKAETWAEWDHRAEVYLRSLDV